MLELAIIIEFFFFNFDIPSSLQGSTVQWVGGKHGNTKISQGPIRVSMQGSTVQWVGGEHDTYQYFHSALVIF